MVPRGHLSRHPTALEIAGSSISISPALDDPFTTIPTFQRPERNSTYFYNPPEDDPSPPAPLPLPLPLLYKGTGRQRSTSSIMAPMLDPPSSSAAPPNRPVPSRKSRSSRIASTTTAELQSAHVNPSPYTEHEDFLDTRRAEAAAHYLRPEDQNMDAVYRRRVQVEYAVNRAKERIVQLGLKSPSQKHHSKGCMANTRRQIQIIKKNNPLWGLWGEQLKEIEGSFGSAVMITFAFLRWAFLLNVCLSLLWISAIVIPFFLRTPSSYQWKGIKQYFQTNGLEKTWIYFGGYYYKSEQTGWYRTDYMYPCTIAAMFLISLVAILATIARRIMGSGDAALVYASDTFPYATVVFTTWDFRITSLEAATKLRKGIRMQLREMLADSILKDKKLDEESRLKYYKTVCDA